MSFSTSVKWAVSLFAIAASVAVAPGVAKADPPKAPGGMGIMAMPSLRQQIRQNAKAEGEWSKGTSLRLQYSQSGKTVSASLWNKTTFGGGAQPIKPTREMMAVAKFRVVQVSEGQLARPVQHSGQTWQPIYRLFQASGPAK